MRSRSSILLLPLLLLAAAANVARAQLPADEAALLAVYRAASNSVSETSGRLAAGFVRQFSNAPVAVVARQWAGVAALKAGHRDEAETLLGGMLGGESPLATSADALARRWLTRSDREKVVVGLKAWYAEHADFPNSVDQLKMLKLTNAPPLVDRWNRPWRYRLAEFKRVRGLTGQKYVLESTNINRDNELKAALAQPPVDLPYVAAKVLGRDPGRESVSFTKRAGGTVVLQVGADADGVTLAYVGRGIAVLSDGERFHVLQVTP